MNASFARWLRGSAGTRAYQAAARHAGRVAAVSLALVTGLSFLSVVSRYLFNWPLPDSYDVTRLLHGVAIFWGLALAARHDDNITLDLLWEVLRDRGRAVLGVFSGLITAAFFVALAWKTGEQVLRVVGSGEETAELRLAVWPFYLVAWIGLIGAVAFTLARVWGDMAVLLGRARPAACAGQASRDRNNGERPGEWGGGA